MKKLALIALVLAAVYVGGIQTGFIPGQHDTDTPASGADQALTAAFENHRSNVQVEGSGRVTRVLPDDNDRSRHQRFIVQLGTGQTVLVAHNIDLAARAASLKSETRSSSTASTNGMSGAASSIGRIAIRNAAMWTGGSGTTVARINNTGSGAAR